MTGCELVYHGEGRCCAQPAGEGVVGRCGMCLGDLDTSIGNRVCHFPTRTDLLYLNQNGLGGGIYEVEVSL